ncbi:MAG: arginine--tRNA ligase [Microgenomates group bacterium]
MKKTAIATSNHQINKTITTDSIKFIIGNAVEACNFVSPADIQVRYPTNSSHGDFTSNVAMQISGSDGTSKRQIADQLVIAIREQLQTSELEEAIDTIEVAGPGFINFTLSKRAVLQGVQKFVRGAVDTTSQDFSGKKIMCEFTDPNPFKELHIGHLYSNAVGESISRIHEAVGATVKRVAYQGDVGMHVAKSIWGMMQILEVKTILDAQEILKIWSEKSLSDRIKLLGKSYALGATQYEESEIASSQIKDINYLTYRAGQEYLEETENWQAQVPYGEMVSKSSLEYPVIKLLYQTGRAWSLDYFEKMYSKIGMKTRDNQKHFDEYFFESLVAEYGYKIVSENISNGIFEKSNGAVIFPGEKYGLHSRVFINSLGLPTYEAKELGLAPEKFRRFAYDKSIIITGNEIAEYFKVLLKALELLNPDLRKKTTHISHGMVRLPEGKMSSRTGKILTAEWLVEEATVRIRKVVDETRAELPENDRQHIAEAVGLGAIKYAFLSQGIGSDIAFNFEQSLSFQGDSGPYLQYSLVRCISLLEKAKKVGYTQSTIADYFDILLDSSSQFDSEEEMQAFDILRNLLQYYDVIQQSALQTSPHLICSYLHSLAQQFNAFYNAQQIVPESLSEPNSAHTLYISLVSAVARVFRHGFEALGIPVIEKM